MYGFPPPFQDDLTLRPPSSMPAQPQPQPTPTLSATSPLPLPDSGPAMTPRLATMCRDIERMLRQAPTFMENARSGVRPLQRVAKGLQGVTLKKKSQQNGIGGGDMSEMLAKHRGPIVFLGINGMPEYYFEQHDGQWQAYHGFDLRPCVPNRSPDDVLQIYLQRPGTLFNVLHSPFKGERESHPVSHDDLLVIEPVNPDRSRTASLPSLPLPAHEPHRDIDGDDDDRDGDRHRAALRSPLRRSLSESHLSLRRDDPHDDDASTVSSTPTTRTTHATRAARDELPDLPAAQVLPEPQSLSGLQRHASTATTTTYHSLVDGETS